MQNLNVKEKRVLLRVDFNVPFNENDEITDSTRIKETLPTIQWLLSQGASVILLSHRGRPKGPIVKPDSKLKSLLSLKPCAEKLSEFLGQPVLFADDCVGNSAQEMSKKLQPGDVLLLENTRFHPGEEDPESHPEFTAKLASLGDLYINDAFGAAHRIHASTCNLAAYFPKNRAAGFLVQKEIEQLSLLLTHPKQPFFVIIGGSKISSKLGILKSVLKKANAIFIGGGMAFTFLEATGVSIGDSLHEPELLDEAKTFLQLAASQNVHIYLPEDVVIADQNTPDAKKKIISIAEGVPEGWRGMDIGPKTLTLWHDLLLPAATIFWNGPMGVFEFPRFAEGTKKLAQTVASLDAMTIVGGGDSVSAITQFGLIDRFNYVSTGGGAALEFLEFGKLPGIEALKE